MISYKSGRNGGITLADFGFGESDHGISPLQRSEESSPHLSCSTSSDVAMFATLKNQSLLSGSQALIPPEVNHEKSAMYQAVMRACEKVGKRLPTFEYADILVELEVMDWRARESTIERYIRYLCEDGRLKKYAKGVYGL